MNVGEKIRKLRKVKNMSIEGFWDEFKIPKSNASVIERNWDKRKFDISLLPHIAEKLGVSIDELFGKELPVIEKEYDSAKETFSIPVAGPVAAGIMSFSINDADIESLKIDLKLLPKQKDIFDGKPRLMAFYVEGDSMEPDIKANDYVIVDRNLTIDNFRDHDIVIAKEKKDTKYTLKKFFKPDAHIDTVVLLPGNPKHKPIPIKAKDVEIIGKVILVIKKL